MSDYDSRPDTREHIDTVRRFLYEVIGDLNGRAEEHDRSKLEEPELSVFNEYTPKLRDSTYGSLEYKQFLEGMGEGLKHHYRVNDHHPEHFVAGDPVAIYSAGYPDSAWQQGKLCTDRSGIHAMNLVQMIEMLADWKAATLRHADGDLKRSIEQNAERFGYGEEIQRLLLHTAAYFGWLDAE
jgi:hypothetical protein